MNITGVYRKGNIGSGNGLVLWGYKPLSEPMLTQSTSPYIITRPQWVNGPCPNECTVSWLAFSCNKWTLFSLFSCGLPNIHIDFNVSWTQSTHKLNYSGICSYVWSWIDVLGIKFNILLLFWNGLNQIIAIQFSLPLGLSDDYLLEN